MRDDEYRIQCAVVAWIAFAYPRALFTISPSGMKLPISVAAKLKRMGYLAGTPDLLIFEARGKYHGLFVELKTLKGKLTIPQQEFLACLNRRGYLAVVAYGYNNAVKVIDDYFSERGQK